MTYGWSIELFDAPVPDQASITFAAPYSDACDLAAPTATVKLNFRALFPADFTLEAGDPVPGSIDPSIRLTNVSGIEWPQHTAVQVSAEPTP